MGNCALIRYADDWLLLTNGSKAEAIRLKEEFQTFLWSEFKLELSPEKTHITHVNQGFDFLGFHVQRYVKSNDRPKMLVTPAQENIKKCGMHWSADSVNSIHASAQLKLKVKEMTRRKWFQDSPLLKISALNAVLRGWINYYRHTNTKKIAKDLDFWVNERLFLWLSKRHKVSKRKVLDRFKLRENGKRWNFGVVNGDNYLFLYRMSDLPLKKYCSRSPDNPYLEGFGTTTANPPEKSLSNQIWMGNADNVTWRELKEKIKAIRGTKCECCGALGKLDLHDIVPRKNKGKDTEDNLQLLCRPCHAQTPSCGRR